jgi:pilus assembly protein CpaB
MRRHVLGLLAVYFANVFLARTEQRAQVANTGTAKVAVASVPLDYGVEVTPEKVRFVDFPIASIPPGSYRTMTELLPAGKRRIALRPMQINEPILASKITGEGQNASIASLLPDGMRAAAVRINDVSGVAGFIQPNDSVDVLITRTAGAAETKRELTDVLLQNVRVIAIDQDANSADAKPTLAKTATLELTPLDAQKLALAQQVGTLSLVLRKPGEEQNNPAVQTVSLGDLRYSLYGGSPYSRASSSAMQSAAARVNTATRRPVVRRVTRPAAPVVTRPATNSIQVIRGTEGSNYEVGGYDS